MSLDSAFFRRFPDEHYSTSFEYQARRLSKAMLPSSVGSGHSPTWYSGHTGARVFEVALNKSVTLSGLSIRDGSSFASVSSQGSDDGYGGGILNHGNLTLNGCTVTNCHAFSEGGGIFSDGTLTVGGCTISGNYALYGAGISNRGTSTLTSSNVSENQAVDLTSDSYHLVTEGGGMVNHGTMTISGCTVTTLVYFTRMAPARSAFSMAIRPT